MARSLSSASFLFAASLAAAQLFVASKALAQNPKPPKRTMNLNAAGIVKAAPDMAIISIGVDKTGSSARKALMANTAAMSKVLAELKASGVEPKDMQTNGFSVQPRYDYDKNNRRPPKIIGYVVSNSLIAAIRDLNRVGAILDKVVTLGSNRVNSINFTISDPEPLKDEARRKAAAAVMAKAELYAKATGITLGPIQSIIETGGYHQPLPAPAPRAMADARAEHAKAVPTAAGEHQVNVQVHIVWEIQ